MGLYGPGGAFAELLLSKDTLIAFSLTLLPDSFLLQQKLQITVFAFGFRSLFQLLASAKALEVMFGAKTL